MSSSFTKFPLLHRIRPFSKYPYTVLVVVGGTNSHLDSVVSRFKKHFGDDKVASHPVSDAWDSLRARSPVRITSGRSVVVTNGLVPLKDREVRYVIGLGVPWVGRDKCAKLMEGWCDLLDKVVDQFRATSRLMVQTDLWVDMSHRAQVRKIHILECRNGLTRCRL